MSGDSTETYRCLDCRQEFTREKAQRKRNAQRPRCRLCALRLAIGGKRNPQWKGGTVFSFDGNGRCRVVCRDNTRMTYARALMCGHLGRLLERDEHVHHINGDKTDDRLENLSIIDIREHGRIHGAEAHYLRGVA